MASKEVRFDIWCQKCEFHKNAPTDDPCNMCLAYFANIDSTKPVYWKEAVNNDRNEQKGQTERIR